MNIYDKTEGLVIDTSPAAISNAYTDDWFRSTTSRGFCRREGIWGIIDKAFDDLGIKVYHLENDKITLYTNRYFQYIYFTRSLSVAIDRYLTEVKTTSRAKASAVKFDVESIIIFDGIARIEERRTS